MGSILFSYTVLSTSLTVAAAYDADLQGVTVWQDS
jgi:hypothetical protein